MFIVCMDKIPVCSQVFFGGRRISSLLFADVVVLLGSLGGGHQSALFTAKCEATEIRINTSSMRPWSSAIKRWSAHSRSGTTCSSGK